MSFAMSVSTGLISGIGVSGGSGSGSSGEEYPDDGLICSCDGEVVSKGRVVDGVVARVVDCSCALAFACWLVTARRKWSSYPMSPLSHSRIFLILSPLLPQDSALFSRS